MSYESNSYLTSENTQQKLKVSPFCRNPVPKGNCNRVPSSRSYHNYLPEMLVATCLKILMTVILFLL